MLDARRVGPIVAVLGLGACLKIRVPPPQDEGASESTDTGSSESESETGEPPPADLGEPAPSCQPVAYEDCYEAQLDEFAACLADCVAAEQSCTAPDCEAACEAAREAAAAACEALCPPTEDGDPVCDDRCTIERVACSAAGCSDNECEYAEYACGWDDCGCQLAYLDYAWAGSCELVFPGPIVAFSIPFTYVLIGGQDLLVTLPSEADCSDPAVGAVFGPGDLPDRMTLCESGCLMFAEVGTAEVVLGSPPCE